MLIRISGPTARQLHISNNFTLVALSRRSDASDLAGHCAAQPEQETTSHSHLLQMAPRETNAYSTLIADSCPRRPFL
jgi:hypothetical protein